jgi:hypothetical protein
METPNYASTNRFKKKDSVIDNTIRERVLDYSKEFKTSWIKLGQTLFTVWEDKLFHAWGHEKFEHYCKNEIGLKKEISLKLLKTYFFIEQEEPVYLREDFTQDRTPVKVPGFDEANVLRLAKQKKELTPDDYNQIRKSIFEKGKDASAVRKDLTQMIKERKEVDPDEERESRQQAALKKLLSSLKIFQKDSDALKLLPEDIIEEAQVLMDKLEKHVL